MSTKDSITAVNNAIDKSLDMAKKIIMQSYGNSDSMAISEKVVNDFVSLFIETAVTAYLVTSEYSDHEPDLATGNEQVFALIYEAFVTMDQVGRVLSLPYMIASYANDLKAEALFRNHEKEAVGAGKGLIAGIKKGLGIKSPSLVTWAGAGISGNALAAQAIREQQELIEEMQKTAVTQWFVNDDPDRLDLSNYLPPEFYDKLP